jgi:hypothetical protein
MNRHRRWKMKLMMEGTEHQAIVLRNLTQFPGYKEVEVVVRDLEASIQSAKKLTVRFIRTVRVLMRTGTHRDASTSTNRSRDGEKASGPKELRHDSTGYSFSSSII